MEERREVCQMQREFCEKEFTTIKEKQNEQGRELSKIGKIVENGLAGRLKRVETLIYMVLVSVIGASVAVILQGGI